MSRTIDNLKAAFAGESQANRRYLAFAKKAAEQGMPQVAKLFNAAAAAETVHAHAHLRVLGGVKETAENLKEAIAGEHHEFASMYPEFLEAARAEKNAGAEKSFEFALAVEKIHHQLYTDALAAVQSGKDLPAREVWVCGVCGNTVYGEPPDKCPICGVAHDKFSRVE
jgi:rubrerythrin